MSKTEATRLAEYLEAPLNDANDVADEAAALLRRWPAGEPVGHLHSNGDFCQDRALDSLAWPVPLYTAPPAESERIAALEAALGKIDAIRNSIIGAQKVNWSEHIYPLVAALEAAGYHGQEYEVARENVGTMVARIAALEAALGELVALKDLKERIEAADASTYSLSDASAAQALADEYDRRKAPAWQAARAALRAIGEVSR